MKKKILSILLSFIIIVCIAFPLNAYAAVGTNRYDETEPNSTLATAKRIYSDSTVSGSLYDTDLDYFKFVLYSTQNVTLLVQSTSSRIYACIDDADGDVVCVGTSSYDDGYYYDKITKTLSAGTYYICLLNNERYYSTSYLFYFDYTSTSSHTHSYSNDCDTTCNTCGATRSVSGHSYSNSCDSSCNNCGYNRTVSDHTYSGTCDSTCNKCGYTRVASGHIYTNSCDETCNTCGEYRDVAHSDVCNIVASSKPTCTESGYEDYACSICGSYVDCIEIPALGHNCKTTTTKATTSKNGKVVKKCIVCGKVVSTTTLYYAKKVKLSTTEYTYNGKAKKPSVKVYDYEGNKISSSNYTVSYASGRKNVGKYKVTIKLKGNYSGTLTAYFTIAPKKSKVSSISASKKSLKVKISKVSSQATGYEIQYSTSSKFSSKYTKTKKVTSYKTTSVTLKSLKAKKLYYVRVRTYKTVDGKKYYSGWSSINTKATSHTHSYSKATCTKAKTCKICNATSGKALGHTKNYATCTRCGKVLFKKLTYTGIGIDKINNINIPEGDYILKLVATGLNKDVIDNCFVYLYNGGSSYTKAYAGVTVSVPIYGWSSSENDPFEGPVKNGTIKVDTSDEIKWKITIEPY